MTESKSPQDKKQDSMTLWQTIKSVNASFLGVQNKANRERDFTKGKPHQFIIVGVLMTLVFVSGVVIAVKLVLNNAGL